MQRKAFFSFFSFFLLCFVFFLGQQEGMCVQTQAFFWLFHSKGIPQKCTHNLAVFLFRFLLQNIDKNQNIQIKNQEHITKLQIHRVHTHKYPYAHTPSTVLTLMRHKSCGSVQSHSGIVCILCANTFLSKNQFVRH